MSYHEKFNQTFCEFLDDIIRVFPNDSDFRMYKMAFQTAILMDTSMVQCLFHDKVVVPYAERILEKDNSFFLEHDYQEITTNYHDANIIIDKLKKYWSGLSQENKDVVWKYFRVLILLDRKIKP